MAQWSTSSGVMIAQVGRCNVPDEIAGEMRMLGFWVLGCFATMGYVEAIWLGADGTTVAQR